MLYRTWEHVEAEQPPAFYSGGHLVLAGHAEIREVLADPVRFPPDNALDAITPLPVAVMRVLAGYRFRLPATLANNGRDDHPKIRATVFAFMTPERVEAQRGWLSGQVRRRLARLAETVRTGAELDLHAELARDLPLAVLARITGLDFADVARVKDFSSAALELFWAPLDLERQLHLAHRVGAYHVELRRIADTGGGLAEALRGQGLGSDQVTAALFFLLVAGQETTSQFLTLLLHRLLRSPELLAGEPDVVGIVEEGLRLEPPIPTWRRLAAGPGSLAGVEYAAGTSIVLWLGAAGRNIGHEFVPGQPGSRRHLAFGAGAHRCLGAQLARMEAAVVLTEALPLLRRLRVTRAPSFPDNLSFRMPDALGVKSVA